MAWQKVHKQGKIKVMVSIQSPVPTSLLLCEKMDEALYILTIIFIFSLFVYFLARHSYISFHF